MNRNERFPQERRLQNNRPERRSGDWRRFFRLIRETKPSYPALSAALALSIATTLVGLAIPLFTKHLIDGFTLASISATQIVVLAAVFVGQAVTRFGASYMLSRIGQGMVASLRDRLWRKLLKLPVPYYDRHSTGETVSRVTSDTAVVKGLITDQLSGFITGIINVIGSLALLLTLNWQMTLAVLVAIPLATLCMLPVGRLLRRNAYGMQEETAKFTATLTQVLSEVRLVKLSGAETREYDNGHRGIAGMLRFGLQEGKIQALVAPLGTFVMMALLVLVIGYGGLLVSSGAFTAGELVAFILYLIQVVMPTTQIANFFTQLQRTLGATERIVSLLEADEETFAAGKPLSAATGPIVLDRVTFAYPRESEDEAGGSGEKNGEPAVDVLRDISFTIEPGRTTAIVGPSGGGKTTLFSLLERFYSPTGGGIRLGDEPIESYALGAWRRRIGYVSQESPLIAGTVRDNIVYGMDRDVSDGELKSAAAMAYADVFIDELPQGYDTEVGERGVKLSGGQRQRIAIARALLRDPDILMMDEATSSLDSKSELVVQQALRNLMAGRTTLVIAHRLSTVVDASRIVFIERGAVTGIGTHEELFRTHALYREFAAHQLRMSDEQPLPAGAAR
ncbi:MAG: ABC transporter ATP-binding protein [Paenibacillaceae bacterium]|nr:ABC transporter ATP-binding protein [Paenibacillaceae bacterium]